MTTPSVMALLCRYKSGGYLDDDKWIEPWGLATDSALCAPPSALRLYLT